MSELINNSKKRQEQLRQIILSLHDGRTTLDEAKAIFQEQFGTVTTEEITQMEQSLLKEGIKVEEIQRLCDVHAAVFDGSIEDIHSSTLQKDYSKQPGHPIEVFLKENERLQKLIKEEIEPYFDVRGKTPLLMLRIGFERLWELDKHYARKEYLFFPQLEKRGITAPPKVMWGVDDEIRAGIKEVKALLDKQTEKDEIIWEKGKAVIQQIKDMITKENNILIPLLKQNLNLVNWIDIDKASKEMGYFLEAPTVAWQAKPGKHDEKKVEETGIEEGNVKFDAGALSVEQLNSMLNTLPFDLTFVDAEGYVKYFTQGKERIFARPLTVIGRHVSLCHPPASVHVVEEIVESFRSGKKDHEDFWIKSKGMMIYIRYFAVRDKQGTYLGTLEISQNIQPIRELEGEKRLVEK